MGPEENLSPSEQIKKGESCLLNVMDEHFLVKILEVGEDSIRVSFPGRDYPVEGMRVYLEFHDETGFDCYPAEVRQGPDGGGKALLIDKPTSCRRTLHRLSCRIPTDLTVQVKDQVHLRKYDAAVMNLSSGGALIRTSAPFDFSTTVEFNFSLPGEPSYTAIGQVVHVASPDEAHGQNDDHLYGVRFLDPDSTLVQSINRYVTRRLRDLYPAK